MQTTTTSLLFISSKEQLLPSAHSRPENFGAGSPILRAAASAAAANVSAAQAAIAKRTIENAPGEDLQGTREVRKAPNCNAILSDAIIRRSIRHRPINLSC